MVRFGYRRRLSAPSLSSGRGAASGNVAFAGDAFEIWTATATFLVAMVSCPITATAMFGMGHGPQISSE
jgi:hypothetical protein